MLNTFSPILSVDVQYAGSIPNAHASAVKGVWTDGELAFSTGLDQRLRCWRWVVDFQRRGCYGEAGGTRPASGDAILVEERWVVTEVPEPSGLDVLPATLEDGRTHYSVAIGGRGIQVIEYSE